MLELTHVHVLFRNSHFANDFNFNVNEPVRVKVEVYVDFATSLMSQSSNTNTSYLLLQLYRYTKSECGIFVRTKNAIEFETYWDETATGL